MQSHVALRKAMIVGSYHTVHAFPNLTHVNGSLMVSDPYCHAKGPRFKTTPRQDDATHPALVAVVSYQFTTDLPLPSTLESFKFNLSKNDLVFLSDFDRGPSFEPWSFGMAARVANHKATVDMK